MLSKNQLKSISSLHQKKYRFSHQLFFAEGVKVIQELLTSNFELDHLYTTKDDFQSVSNDKKTLISETELKKITALATPNSCLAVFKIPKEKKTDPKTDTEEIRGKSESIVDALDVIFVLLKTKCDIKAPSRLFPEKTTRSASGSESQ